MTDQEPWSWTRRWRIASDPAAGRAVLDELLGQLEVHGWDETDRFAVHLALEEALVNAIRHGNQCAADKYVDVEGRVAPERVWIEIADEGPGFDPSCVPDPTLDENLEVPSGRGLMLMASFMTRVQFHGCGNRVTLEKHRTPE